TRRGIAPLTSTRKVFQIHEPFLGDSRFARGEPRKAQVQLCPSISVDSPSYWTCIGSGNLSTARLSSVERADSARCPHGRSSKKPSAASFGKPDPSQGAQHKGSAQYGECRSEPMRFSKRPDDKGRCCTSQPAHV